MHEEVGKAPDDARRLNEFRREEQGINQRPAAVHIECRCINCLLARRLCRCYSWAIRPGSELGEPLVVSPIVSTMKKDCLHCGRELSSASMGS
jgi:hypothetical protein